MKKTILFLLTAVLFIPTSVFAKDNLKLECDKKSLQVGETTTCNVKVVSNNTIAGVTFNLETGDSFELVSMEKDSNWEGLVNKNKLVVYSTLGINSNQSVANIKLKAKISNPNAMVKMKNIEIVPVINGISGSSVNIEDVSKTISIKSDANLVTIFIIVGVLVVIGAVVLIISKSKKKK